LNYTRFVIALRILPRFRKNGQGSDSNAPDSAEGC